MVVLSNVSFPWSGKIPLGHGGLDGHSLVGFGGEVGRSPQESLTHTRKEVRSDNISATFIVRLREKTFG